MPGRILANINPDNTPHGYNLTFAFPMILFIVIALVLYLLFSRPHRRVPGQRLSFSGRSSARTPAAGAARSAAVAGGLSAAAGGGATESPAEPQGAHSATAAGEASAAEGNDGESASGGDTEEQG